MKPQTFQASVLSEHPPDRELADRPARKIVHVDMDAFFASVEQRDDPALRGIPMFVAGLNHEGIVAAASYEARKHGVKGGMLASDARRLCPDIVMVDARMDHYRDVSKSIHQIFSEYTRAIEPQALDEAWLDVTTNFKGIQHATEVAREIRERIRLEIGINSSAGISYNKFLAKMATGLGKPNGQFLISPLKGAAFVSSLPIEDFHGVGIATANRMKALGVHTGADLLAVSFDDLTHAFGKLGSYFYWLARGIDDRPVVYDTIRKSYSREITVRTKSVAFTEAEAALRPLVGQVWEEANRDGRSGRTVAIKLRLNDFSQASRLRSASSELRTVTEFESMALQILATLFPVAHYVRLVGITLSNLADAVESPQTPQLGLWD